MRWGTLVVGPLFVLGCASRASYAPPPAAPPPPPQVAASDPAPTPPAPQPLYRWYCFADTQGAGTDCARTLDQCNDAAQQWANDDQDGDGVGDNQSTPCAGQQVAYCYSYVPDDSTSGDPITLCQETMDSCQSSAGVAMGKPGTQTACAETQ
jgi:hypothetical protein